MYMGRKKKSAEEKKGTIVNTKVSYEQNENIKKMCKATGMKKSELLRLSISSVIADWWQSTKKINKTLNEKIKNKEKINPVDFIDECQTEFIKDLNSSIVNKVNKHKNKTKVIKNSLFEEQELI